MNNMDLTVFESKGFEPIVYEKSILFEPYKVGKTLGLAGSSIQEKLENMTEPNEKIRVGNNKRYYITEAGLYHMIMVTHNKKTEPFHEWICCDVLPSIRKYGCYPPTDMAKYLYKLAQINRGKEEAVKNKDTKRLYQLFYKDDKLGE